MNRLDMFESQVSFESVSQSGRLMKKSCFLHYSTVTLSTAACIFVGTPCLLDS